MLKKTKKKLPTSKSKPLTPDEVGLKYGFRSGLEEKTADWLTERGIKFGYENRVINYLIPERPAKYTPDFNLPNGVIVETKGLFELKDRQKHLLIKHQYPKLDIRFVFTNSKARISKQSTTTYAAWCEKYGFMYSDKTIPVEWLSERLS